MRIRNQGGWWFPPPSSPGTFKLPVGLPEISQRFPFPPVIASSQFILECCWILHELLAVIGWSCAGISDLRAEIILVNLISWNSRHAFPWKKYMPSFNCYRSLVQENGLATSSSHLVDVSVEGRHLNKIRAARLARILTPFVLLTLKLESFFFSDIRQAGRKNAFGMDIYWSKDWMGAWFSSLTYLF